MITSKELAEALGNVLPFVVTSVVDCRGDDCEEPCCRECYGEEKAKDEAGIAGRAHSASRKLLRQWKEQEDCQTCHGNTVIDRPEGIHGPRFGACPACARKEGQP